MLPFELLSICFFASALITIAPGPDNIFVLTQSALYGRSAGLLATLGVCTGLLVHTAAASFGVAAVFQTSALAFNILKVLGVLYLLYLAWQIFRTGGNGLPQDPSAGMKKVQLYIRGVIMNVTNPKVAIFFLAFLPQFIDPTRGFLILQTLALGMLFIAITFVIFGSIALGGASWASGSRTPGAHGTF